VSETVHTYARGCVRVAIRVAIRGLPGKVSVMNVPEKVRKLSEPAEAAFREALRASTEALEVFEMAVFWSRSALREPDGSDRQDKALDRALQNVDRAARMLCERPAVAECFGPEGVRQVLQLGIREKLFSDSADGELRLRRLWPGQKSTMPPGDGVVVDYTGADSQEAAKLRPYVSWLLDQQAGQRSARYGGRPSGSGASFKDVTDFRTQVAAVCQELRDDGKKITRESVSKRLFLHPDTFDTWRERSGRSFRELCRPPAD
jgi:hypothetical protein